MEHEKVVVKKPKCFADEAFKRGSSYYDYENNINVIPRYFCLTQRRLHLCLPAKNRQRKVL